MPATNGNTKTEPTQIQICKVMEVDGRRNAVLVAAEFVTTETDEYGNTSKDSSTQLAMCAVLCNGVTNLKYVHNFAVGEYVVCVFPSTDDYNPYAEYFEKLREKSGLAEEDPRALGFTMGTFYSEDNEPPVKYPEVTQISFGDNNYIRIDNETKEIIIKCAGDFSINAKGIFLNG